jgi:replicative DNA helicase
VVQAPPRANRIPPHNLDAEQCVLGAMLESKEAIANVLEVLDSGDFYAPGHADVYSAIMSLYGSGRPADAITVAEELDRRGQLEGIGGRPYMLGLLEAYPTASSASHYARIVEEHALLRRLIDAGNKVQEIGFSMPEDVAEAVDRSEEIMYQVGDRRLRDDVQPIHKLLVENMEAIEALYDRGAHVTGLGSGFPDLDDMTAGFQPQNLVIVAARPSMGKCVSSATSMVDPLTGERTSIKEFVERRRPFALSVGSDGSVRPREVADWIPAGTQECRRLVTRTGRSIEATPSHPFLGVAGWVALSDLAPGSRIAVPRSIAAFGEDRSWPLERVRVLGRLLAEGSEATRFPGCVWRFDRERLAALLEAIFSCNGVGHSSTGCLRLELTVASMHLARDVHHSLVRFGIVADLAAVTGGRWRVEISDPAAADRYRREIGWIGAKATRGSPRRAEPLCSDGGHVPREAWALVRKALEAEGMSLSELARRSGEEDDVRTSGDIPQHRLALYAELLGSDDLRWLANDDLYWDEVVSIEPVGPKETYDLTVPDGSNFIASDICIHNSALMSDFALHAAVQGGAPVVVFSLEMSRHEMVQRFLSSQAKVDSQRLRRGSLQEQDWTRLSAALGRLAEAPIFIDDSANITLMEMRAKCRRLKAKHGLRLVLIDYLQLMQSPRRSENRQQEVSEISRALKILARELNVPVICASQLNRGVEYRQDKRPLLGDLRESGAIEQDADIVMFLYRDEVYNPDTEEKGEAELHVAKHRNGPTGKVRLAFMSQYTRFASFARGHGF